MRYQLTFLKDWANRSLVITVAKMFVPNDIKEADVLAAAPCVNRLNVTLPTIARFNSKEGLKALEDALRRKKDFKSI